MSVMELQSNIMSSTSYFLSSIFSSSNERLEKSSHSACRNSRDSLRELHSAAIFLDLPKWPVECQVLPQRIFHISTIPSKPQPFYSSSGSEPQPRPVGEEMGSVIYDYQPKLSVDYYCRSTTSIGTEVLETFAEDKNTLRFESRFECGNLCKVIKITNVYYELYLRPDMYTDRHSQWYYFKIQNMKEGVLYRFSIVNLNKPDSLYRYGLKPLIYSERNAQYNDIGWIRCGKNVAYFKNDLTTDENGSYYTLTFNLKFKYDNDTVYIAQCYPYSYSNLQNYLRGIEVDRFKTAVCQTRLLCKTLGGNNVYILTITSPPCTEANDDEEADKKAVIFLTARVHPGETPSSYMMKGIIDFLTSDCPQAQVLRDRFIFKIIPMLNPDGVIVGNSRCCLLGQDLNRQYGTVLREAFPQIYHAKVILRRLAEENRLFLYCDIHGHSRKNNAFIYGCENRRISEKKLTEQIFPLMMHKNASDKFSFQSCKFKVQKSKEGTGRLFVWTLGVANSYTLEVSLGGSTLASRQQTHFHVGDYEGLGRHFCETLLDYSDPLKEPMREKLLQKLIAKGSTADEPVNVPMTDYSSLSHSESDNGSSEDAEPENEEKSPTVVKRQPSIRISPPKTKTRKQKLKTVLNISKASVELISYGRKHSTDTVQVEEESTIKVIESPSKSRRLRHQESIMASMERKRIFQSRSSSLRKYSKVVFDNPFSPPDPDASIMFLSSNTRNEKLQSSYDFGMAQSEDECDQTDSGFRSQKLVEQLSFQISSLTISKAQKTVHKVPEKVDEKANTESKQLNSVDQFQVDIKSSELAISQSERLKLGVLTDSVKKQIKRSKSQRVEDDGKPESGANQSRLSVPKLSQRRGSWAGGPPPTSSNAGSSGTGSHSQRSSTNRIGENTKTKTIRKSISMGDSICQSDEPKKKDATNSVLNKNVTVAVASVQTTKKRKLQSSKKNKLHRKQS